MIFKFGAVGILTVIWLIMNDGVSVYNLIIGAVLSVFCVYISCKMLEIKYEDNFKLPVFKFARYVVRLIRSVYTSGVQASRMILTGKIAPGFIRVRRNKEIESEFLHNILENSITLTPGTITVDSDEEYITVLCLHCDKDAPSPTDGFEPQLVEMQKSLNEKQKKHTAKNRK